MYRGIKIANITVAYLNIAKQNDMSQAVWSQKRSPTTFVELKSLKLVDYEYLLPLS